MLKFNGKPFKAEEFSRALEQGVVKSVVEQVREKYGSIRHPETGEFPTVFATGDTLASLKLKVEGSRELLQLVQERHKGDEVPIEFVTKGDATPRVFLSYAWENKLLAEKIASALQANGIETWWAGWCIAAGDSLRQKIEEGLGECTHFIVLLTPDSVHKPWVNQEMDAGLIRTLSKKSRFIPLRHQLPPTELPPLLSGMLSPEVDAEASNILQLVNDIHGVTRKPPLGQAPTTVKAAEVVKTGYSAAASAIAQVLVQMSKGGRSYDPQIPLHELGLRTELSHEDVHDALHELSSLVHVHREEVVWPEDEFFSEFDKFWMPWNPAEDALKLAADMVNIAGFPDRTEDISARYGWDARRLNPAISYLASRDLVHARSALDTHFVAIWVGKTDATRRFVKSRG